MRSNAHTLLQSLTLDLGWLTPYDQYAPLGKYPAEGSTVPIGSFSCSLEAILFLVGGKWKPLILYHLRSGPQRYGALRRAVGRVSHKMLIQQLKELAADGIVERRDFAEVPPRVEYALCGVGVNLAEALAGLGEWGTSHASELEVIVSRRIASLQSK